MKKKNNLVILQPVQPVAPLEQVDSNFYNVPVSPVTNLIMETLGAGSDLQYLPSRKKQINHNTSYEYSEEAGKRQISIKSDKEYLTLEISEIDKLLGSNKPAKKMFSYILGKANEQALHNGRLTKNYISFSLKELVESGLYKTTQSAHVGFDAAMDALTSLKFKGRIQLSKKRNEYQDSMRVLFTGSDFIKGQGQCVVYLNTEVSWGMIAQYFTILPPYVYKLPNKAFDLLYYIFYLARQHTREIMEKGFFNISFRSIQHRLQLPSEIGNSNPYRTIKKPILEDALEPIEDEHGLMYHGTAEFSVTPMYDENASISEFLDKGYLRVELRGSFAQSFIQLSQNQAKQIEQAEKRKARIAEKAMAINTAKAMEANGEQE